MFYIVLLAFGLQLTFFLGLSAWGSAAGGLGPVADNEGGHLFSFLEAINPELVAAHLARQKPATAAGVLAALEPGFADMVLACWPRWQVDALVNRVERDGALSEAEQHDVAVRLRRDFGLPPAGRLDGPAGSSEMAGLGPGASRRASWKPGRRVRRSTARSW